MEPFRHHTGGELDPPAPPDSGDAEPESTVPSLPLSSDVHQSAPPDTGVGGARSATVALADTLPIAVIRHDQPHDPPQALAPDSEEAHAICSLLAILLFNGQPLSSTPPSHPTSSHHGTTASSSASARVRDGDGDGDGELLLRGVTRRCRWDRLGSSCARCPDEEAKWFAPCCLTQLCDNCSAHPSPRCRCGQPRFPVPLQAPFEVDGHPIRRTLVYLRWPRWQIYQVAESRDRVIIWYYNTEEAFRRQEFGVTFCAHVFLKDGSAIGWRRRYELTVTVPSHPAPAVLELRLAVFDNPQH